MPITSEPFGRTADGAAVERYTLTNANGLEAAITSYGGTLTSLRVPDRNGVFGDVVLGFDTLAPYLGDHPYFGALIGRFCNRIAGGQFTLNGVTYTLARNDGRNHLHGGPHGFHRAVWSTHEHRSAEGPGLELRYLSHDGEEGYPGNLDVRVIYTLTDQDALRIDYTATTDRDTLVNLTHHAYFNLAGGGILGHQLQLHGTWFLPIDESFIPLGELRPVQDTPMDFTRPTPIGERIGADDEQLRRAQGYDHTWVMDKPAGALGRAARVYEPDSGRVLEVYTTTPGVQFYSGNMLDGSLTGKGGTVYSRNSGLCLETQHFPDSPNQPRFPSTVLHPGETYRQTTIFQFGVQAKL
ncbi:MAG TPA: aldose epimerase family protein [Roseiflexaceae bacterium]|nr:aldose epimerase family protein [Roseiflexaceae bacterium]